MNGDRKTGIIRKHRGNGKNRDDKGLLFYMVLSLAFALLGFAVPGGLTMPSGRIVAAASLPAAQSVEFMSLFKDNMVVQSGRPVKVWGTYTGDAAGVAIDVRFGDESRTAEAKDGRWSVVFPARDVNKTGQKITATSGEAVRSIDGVLIGDVWLTSGQSNMALTVDFFSKMNAGTAAGYNEISTNPMIRVFTVPKTATGTTAATEFVNPGATSWQAATAVSMRNFTAYGYAFAYYLQQGTDVPLGLIDASFSGTRIEYWLASGACYNKMIYPLKGVEIKGVLWYQGESNTQDYLIPNYTTSFTLFAGLLRTLFNNPELPLVTTQLPRYMDANFSLWPYFRLKQWETAQAVPNTYMVCAVDMGIPTNDIHPYDKIPLARRAAELALHEIYGKSTPGESPYPSSVTVSGDKVILTFANAQSGLEIRGEAIREMMLTDEDGTKAAAQATIQGNVVTLTAPGVKKPFSVTYAVSYVPDVNFYAKNGLPVVPFLIKDLNVTESEVSSSPSSATGSSNPVSSGSSMVSSSVVSSGSGSTDSTEASMESDPASDSVSGSQPESTGDSTASIDDANSVTSSAASEPGSSDNSEDVPKDGKTPVGVIIGVLAGLLAAGATAIFVIRQRRSFHK